LLVEPRMPRANQSLFFSRALAIGDKPSFRVTERSVDALRPDDLDGRALIVLDEVAPPGGALGERLRAALNAGTGVMIVPGDTRAESWPADWRAVAPATIGDVVDRSRESGASLSAIDFG